MMQDTETVKVGADNAIDIEALHKLYDEAAAAILALKDRSAEQKPNFFWLIVANEDGENLDVLSNAPAPVAIQKVQDALEQIAEAVVRGMAADGDPRATIVVNALDAMRGAPGGSEADPVN